MRKKTSQTKAAENKKELAIAQRREIVAANLLAGVTYREIAASLNVAVGTVAGDFKAILKDWKEHYTETVDEWVHVELRRIDVLINAIWPEAKNGNLQAIDRLLKLMEAQAKLLGVSIDRIDLTTKGEKIATRPVFSAEDFTDDELAAIAANGSVGRSNGTGRGK